LVRAVPILRFEEIGHSKPAVEAASWHRNPSPTEQVEAATVVLVARPSQKTGSVQTNQLRPAAVELVHPSPHRLAADPSLEQDCPSRQRSDSLQLQGRSMQVHYSQQPAALPMPVQKDWLKEHLQGLPRYRWMAQLPVSPMGRQP
jgi:hypothetical protein